MYGVDHVGNDIQLKWCIIGNWPRQPLGKYHLPSSVVGTAIPRGSSKHLSKASVKELSEPNFQTLMFLHRNILLRNGLAILKFVLWHRRGTQPEFSIASIMRNESMVLSSLKLICARVSAGLCAVITDRLIKMHLVPCSVHQEDQVLCKETWSADANGMYLSH